MLYISKIHNMYKYIYYLCIIQINILLYIYLNFPILYNNILSYIYSCKRR